jgi:HlyD family secretion protein
MTAVLTPPAGLVDPAQLNDSPRAALIAGGIVAVAFFVVLLGWAAFARLDAAAHGSGQVIVAGNRQVIQHRYGGNIERILVREGEQVARGQVLVRLSGSEVAATERALAASVIDLQAQRARLQAEVTGGAIVWPAEFARASAEDRPLIAAALRLQQAQANARRELLAASRSVLAEQRDQLGQQVRGFEAQARSSKAQRVSLQAQMESTRRLAERGDVSRNTVRALERSLAELDGNEDDFTARAAAAQEQIAGTGQQIAHTRRQWIEQSAVALRDTQFQLNDALPKSIAAREQLERTVIRAPVAGRIVDLRVHSAGGVVTAGQPILDIVPERAPLEIRASFAPEDIDGVFEGRETEVKFLSIHERELPIVVGTVRTVSADSVEDPRTGLSHFTAQIVVPESQVALLRAVRGADTGIRPGVPVQVSVRLRRRTALQYMLDPLTETLSRSFAER